MLRDYQQHALDAIWTNLDRHVVASLPTGSGKSHVIAELCRRALHEFPGTTILVLAHVKELLEQNAQKICQHWPLAPVALFCAGLGRKELAPITVASIQSICRRASRIGPYDLILVDEAHRIPHGDSGMYHDLFRHQPQAKIVGLTATPYRMGGGLLHRGDDALFDDLVCEIQTGTLIEQGHLARIRSRRGSSEADLTRVHTRAGEFVTDEMTDAFDTDQLTRAVVADVLGHAAGRTSVMVFCCSVEHCHHVRAAFRSACNDDVRVVTGETPAWERAQTIADFKSRRCRILVNCDVLTTGFDAPNTDCIVLLRATKSPGLYVQIIGRGLRKADGKQDCLLLDYGRNVERHGPIDSVTARRVESGEEPPPTKECPECGDMIPLSARRCPSCGRDFPPDVKPPHDATAGIFDPLKATLLRYRVLRVRYERHRKFGKPDSMKATYHVAPEDAQTEFAMAYSSRTVSEWVCFEHEGFARSRAVAWANRRGVTPAPATVTEALKCEFAVPKVIVVKHAIPFPEVVHHEF